MRRLFQRVGFIVLATAALSAAQTAGREGNESGSANEQAQSANSANKAPYLVEKQRARSAMPTNSKEQTSVQLPLPKPHPDPISSEGISGFLSESTSQTNAKTGPTDEPQSHVPWEDAKAPVLQTPETTPAPEISISHDGRSALPLTQGSGPLSAVVIVGLGSLAGLLGSVMILKLRFAKPLATRLYGDVAPKGLWRKEPLVRSWAMYADNLQFNTALRKSLISREEFHELRSKYWVAGNFSFSMLVPMFFALVLMTMTADKWDEKLAISVVGTFLTTSLTTYAVDRRHKFRSEYRTLIIQNLKQEPEAQPPGHSTSPPGDAPLARALLRIVVILTNLVARFRPGSKEVSNQD
jgi:hypothetical protein